MIYRGTPEMQLALRAAAKAAGITVPNNHGINIGDSIYRKLPCAKYPPGCAEWNAAVDAMAAPQPAQPAQPAQAGGQPPQAAAAATTATAGTPGTFDGPVPATVVELETLTASPAAAWTTGQYVEAGSGAKRYWDGTDWQTGVAP